MKMLNGTLKLWERSQVALGDGSVEQLTLFEHKRLFSVWSYRWDSVGDQQRSHTHAFRSVAVTLCGSYEQEVMDITSGATYSERVSRWLRPRYLPRNYTHRVTSAEPGTRTVVFAGRWAPHWAEFFVRDGESWWTVYGHGRTREVERTTDVDLVLSRLNKR